WRGFRRGLWTGRWCRVLVAPPGQSVRGRTGPPLSLSHPRWRRKSLRAQRALHHVVGLRAGADRERAIAHDLESLTAVEGLGAGVALVDAEPQARHAGPGGAGEGRVHEAVGDADAVVLGQHVHLAQVADAALRFGACRAGLIE